MIFKRAIAKLRAQDWTAIGIELVIVVLGVFFGMLVSNWNSSRLAADETRETLLHLKPELAQLENFSTSARRYYAVAGKYADVAIAGWHRDPRISDADFVIAAYQASQIYGFNNNGASWALVFNASDLRNIEDEQTRSALTRLMTFDYSTINLFAVATKYRDNVREVIPDSIQGEVRSHCGDKLNEPDGYVTLSTTCPIRLDPALAASVAADLRARPELLRQLGQHRSAVSAYLTNLELFDVQEKLLASRIDMLDRGMGS